MEAEKPIANRVGGEEKKKEAASGYSKKKKVPLPAEPKGKRTQTEKKKKKRGFRLYLPIAGQKGNDARLRGKKGERKGQYAQSGKKGGDGTRTS